MHRRPILRLVSLFLALGLVATACGNRRDDEESTASTVPGGEGVAAEGAGAVDASECPDNGTAGIEGNTIKFVSSFPQSGLTAAFSQISRGYLAYFQMVNDAGGVEIGGEKYTIELEDLDDEYNPARTASNIEELVGPEGDRAFAVFNVVGTANNIAIRDFLGELCVPNVFAATGSPAWGNTEYPWTIGATNPPYSLESKVFAEYLQRENPTAKVAMLVQDDDFGRAYEEGFRLAIEGTDIEVVQVERYASGAAEVSAQMTSLAASGADAFFNGATLLACPNALERATAEGWDPVTFVSGTCISKTLMGLAGANAEGVISATNVKDPLNPAFADDPDLQRYRETVGRYQPEADLDNGIVAYGWTQGELLVEALEATPELNRQSFIQTMRSLEGLRSGLLIEDVAVSTEAPDDLFLGETVQLIQYDSAAGHFRNVGDELLSFEAQTPELTPEELIQG